MQANRLLDDREVFVGDRLFYAQWRSIRVKPEQLGCYVIHVNRTERQLAKELLRDYWVG